jgi:hypothetical protein
MPEPSLNAPQAAAARKARTPGDPASPVSAATAEESQAPAPRALKPLLPAEVKLIESVNVDRAVVACRGAKPEDYCDPGMWGMIDTIYPFDLARIVAADGAWWGLYLLITLDNKVVAARLLMAVDIDKPDAPINNGLPDGYDIRRGEPSDGQAWVAYRKSDGLVLNPGMNHKTYEETRRFLLSHAIFKVDGPTEYL